MIKEQLVGFKVAKLAKEKGFNHNCIYAWCEKGGWNKYTQKHEEVTHVLRTDGNPFGSFYSKNWNKKYSTNKNKIMCSAPTQAALQKWLREEHNIHIVIDTTPSYDSINGSKWKSTLYEPFTKLKWITGKYNIANSYEEALEDALYEGLKLIK